MVLRYTNPSRGLVYSNTRPAALRRTARFLLSLLLCSFSFAFYAQTDGTAQPDILQLLNERSQRISQSAATSDIDLQLFQLGYRPKAVITTTTLENGTIRVEFPTYLALSEDKIARAEQRLTATYPFLSSLQFDLVNHRVSCLFAAGTTTAQFEEITNHFGYDGHESTH